MVGPCLGLTLHISNEIAPEYQDLAYQQMFDAGKLVGAEEKMELELPEVIYIMM